MKLVQLSEEAVIEKLSEVEAVDRYRLETVVKCAFYDAGLALRELRVRRLYRSTHSRFDNYCRDSFGFSQQNADLLIQAAMVVDNLKVTTNGCNFLPTNERQVRPIAKLEPTKQREIWSRAVEKAGNKVPTGKIVQETVNEALGRETTAKSAKKTKKQKPQDKALETEAQSKQMLSNVDPTNNDVRSNETPPMPIATVNTLGITSGTPEVVAVEISIGIKSLTPEQLTWAIDNAASNGLSDIQLRAIIQAASQALDLLHQLNGCTASSDAM